MIKFFPKVNDNRGISLLVAVLVASVALLLGLAISNIAFKEVVLTQSSKDSQEAFYASNSGVECGLFEDLRNRVFDPDIDPPNDLNCNDQIVSVTFTSIEPEDDDDDFCVGSHNGQTHLGCWEFTVSSDIYLDEASAPNTPCFNLRAVKEQFEADEGEGPFTYFTTALESRGYNTCDVNHPRRLERAIRAIY